MIVDISEGIEIAIYIMIEGFANRKNVSYVTKCQNSLEDMRESVFRI
jgi:hypothetical protein